MGRNSEFISFNEEVTPAKRCRRQNPGLLFGLAMTNTSVAVIWWLRRRIPVVILDCVNKNNACILIGNMYVNIKKTMKIIQSGYC